MSDERTTREVKDRLASDLESGKERAREAARSATGDGKQRLEEQSAAMGAGIDDVAEAVDSAASRLRELDHSGLADYTHRMADTLNTMSGQLRNKSVDELAHDVSGIARRNPALFLLGSVAAGLGLARLAKASGRRHSGDGRAGDTRWSADEHTPATPGAGATAAGAPGGGYPAAGASVPADPTGGSGL